jgi:hypothetical protein
MVAIQAVPNHDGSRRPETLELFAPPTQAIGPVQSANSTLTAGMKEMAIGFRLGLAGLAVALAIAIVATNPNTGGWVGFGICIFISLVIYVKTGFHHTVTYVGRDGISSTRLDGKRAAPPKTIELVFRNAAAMFTQQTEHYRNGVYQNTTYDFYWVAPTGARIFSLSGSYGRKNTPVKDQIHFARAAEIAWSQYYLELALQQLGREGSIAFVVDQRRVIRVGHGFLEFHHFSDGPVRVTKAEIAKVTLGGGQFMFKHVDARWYSSEGKFRFSYANMANARVFMLALDKLMGYRWS